MPQFGKIADKLKGLVKGDFKLKLIVLVGLLGMVLILISQFASSGRRQQGAEDRPQDTLTARYTADDYALELEEKLSVLISSIEGVGRAQVMVTLEHSGETVYLQEEKSSVDRTTLPGDGDAPPQVDYKSETENSYVFVDSGYGEKQPLMKTQLPPKVQGVVIVCEGADNVRVEQNLYNVVTTALHIPTTRVCVVKIDAN